MRSVVSIKSGTSVYIPDLVTLPKKDETITVKIKDIQHDCFDTNNSNPIKHYYVEDNAGTIHSLSVVDLSFLPTHNLIQFRVLNIYPCYQLDPSKPRPSYPYKQEKSINWSGFSSAWVDDFPKAQVIKPGDEPVIHKTATKYTPWVKPEDNPVDYAAEVVNQRKLFDTHQSSLQQINLFLRDRSNPFLDIDKLESMITHLNDRDLNLLCSGKAFI